MSEIEKIVKKLTEIIDTGVNCEDCIFQCESDESCTLCAIKDVMQEKQEREKGWIPCSERVPAVRDGSLAYSELFLVTANIRDRVYTYLAYYSSCSGFSGLFGGDWNEHVTAWQPLPEPYKEGENDG